MSRRACDRFIMTDRGEFYTGDAFSQRLAEAKRIPKSEVNELLLELGAKGWDNLRVVPINPFVEWILELTTKEHRENP